MSKTLYLLVDGTHADPDDCDVGADNELRHANGVPVALRADGNPQTVAKGAVENKNVEAAKAGEEAEAEAKQINADDAAAQKAEKDAGDAVVTLIDPATGKPAEDTDAVEPDKLSKDVADGLKSVNEARADVGKASVKAKDVKPETAKSGYKTRESKAR